jgi:hypothetical protein
MAKSGRRILWAPDREFSISANRAKIKLLTTINQ